MRNAWWDWWALVERRSNGSGFESGAWGEVRVQIGKTVKRWCADSGSGSNSGSWYGDGNRGVGG